MNTIADFKQQGNTLFSLRDYEDAAAHYTAAIRLSYSQIPDLEELAATKLDPNAKAFARLATAQHALGEYSDATSSWRSALQTERLGDDAQIAQYMAGLQASMLRLQPVVVPVARLPWEVTAMMLPALLAQRTISREYSFTSAWVIHAAHEEFMNGVRKMGAVQEHTGVLVGMLGSVIALSNGLLRDHRVMQLYPEFTKVEKQFLFEADAFYARTWIGVDPTPEQVVQESIQRWEVGSRAASFIVRIWIIRGQLDMAQSNRYEVAVANCEKCLFVLRRLRQFAPRTNVDQRPVFLEDTFLFGVQALYLEMLIQKYATGFPHNLEQEADLLLTALDQHDHSQISGNNNPGFTSSFLMYPRGTAHSAKGLVARRTAELQASAEWYHKAAMEYIAAADCFPEDDEKHLYHLHLALLNIHHAYTLNFPLPLLGPDPAPDLIARIRTSVPQARAIWAHLSLARAAGRLWDDATPDCFVKAEGRDGGRVKLWAEWIDPRTQT
ncbi:hypothetical protein C8F01DRAFT_1251094 [Mycena amicta]|nr:hypothetical protein C8F01DRAFT_1251094 [Mycena amicta]